MSGQKDPYIRLYFRVRVDDRFDHVYACDTCWAAYSRLLMDAEGSFPSPASLPRTLKSHAKSMLVEAGIIELRPHDMFIVHGLAAEREKRSHQGKAGAAARWQMPGGEEDEEGADPSVKGGANAMRTHSERNANGVRTHGAENANASRLGMQRNASRDEPSLAKPRRDSPKPPDKLGAHDRSRRESGDTPRGNGRSPRQLREGSPEIDARTLARLVKTMPRGLRDEGDPPRPTVDDDDVLGSTEP